MLARLPIDAPETPAWLDLTWSEALCDLIVLRGIRDTVALMLFRDVGRALRAQRDNRANRRSLGVSLTRTRLWAFVGSSALAGLGGGVFAIISGFISPGHSWRPVDQHRDQQHRQRSNDIVGAFLGGLFMVFVPTWASDINLSLGNLIYGLALITVMMVARNGVIGFIEKWLSVILGRTTGELRLRSKSREELK